MSTPAAKWREAGEADPFEGQNYDGERAELCCGHLTDDEMANAQYLDRNIVNATGAKERIRWLSRALVGEQAAQRYQESQLDDKQTRIEDLEMALKEIYAIAGEMTDVETIYNRVYQA